MQASLCSRCSIVPFFSTLFPYIPLFRPNIWWFHNYSLILQTNDCDTVCVRPWCKHYGVRLIAALQPTRLALCGHEGQDILEKRTFTNVIFYRQISQIKHKKKTQRSVRVGCIIPCCLTFVVSWRNMYNISRRGLTRVAYPGQGNARALRRDKRWKVWVSGFSRLVGVG